MTLHVRNVRVLNPGIGLSSAEVLVRAGRIAEVGASVVATEPTVTAIDGGGRLLTPGLIDLHTHGIKHSLYEAGPEGLRSAARELGAFGVTTVLPTVVPQIRDDWIDRLAETAAALSSISGVHVPGLHVEGPFMAVGGAACPILPGDVALLDRILDACANRVRVMSVSPDTVNIIPIIRRLRDRGVTVFLTHTRADVAQTEAALEAGARHATHFYDVFYPPAETDPGVRPVGAVEAILADPRATVDFIADGVHVHPAAIRAAVAAKTWRGVIAITDSNIGAGLPAGTYATPWGYAVRVSPETAARHATENFLAGSALTMDRAIANLLRWLDLPPEQVWAMGTLNPARVIGLDAKGRLEPGADADLVLWDDDLTPRQTWVAGVSSYEKNAG